MTPPRNGFRTCQGLACLVIALTAVSTHAQRVIVQTATRMVTGQTVATTLHEADMTSGTVSPASWRLRGALPAGPLTLTGNGQFAVCATAPARSARIGQPGLDRSSLQLIRIQPLMPERTVTLTSPPGYSWALGGLPGGTADPMALLRETGDGDGRLIAQGLEFSRGRLRGTQAVLAPLPSEPSLVSVHDDFAVVAGIGRDGNLDLSVHEAAGGSLRLVHAIRQEIQGLAVPRVAGLRHSGDGSILYVMVGGYSDQGPSGEAHSWCYAYRSRSLQALGEPLRVTGTGGFDDNAIFPGNGTAAWISTLTPGANHGSVTAVDIAGEGLATLSELSFFELTFPPIVAARAESDDCLIGAGTELAHWRPGAGIVTRRRFDDPIRAIRPTGVQALVGEGHRLHRVDAATLETETAVSFATGIVVDVSLALRSADESSERPQLTAIQRELSEAFQRDDPVPAETTTDVVAPVILPATIGFYGEAVRQEFKAIDLTALEDFGLGWSVEFDEEAMPWLGVSPREGGSEDPLYLVVYPARYDYEEAGLVSGSITIHGRGPGPAVAAAGLPREVEVRIAPPRNVVQRVLWMWPESGRGASLRDPDDPFNLGGLAEMLSQPPVLVAHDEVWGPVAGSLRDYAMVVLPARVAAEGAVTRQEVLDYVAGGGALLLLGAANDEAASQTLSRWLGPIGVEVRGNEALNGRFAAYGDHEIARHWDTFRIDDGCAFAVADPAAVAVTGPAESAVLGQISYGIGRIALLAAATPLETPAMRNLANRRFAADLFGWLSRARQEIDDLDQDGLPNGLEDKNGNNIVDPGETNRFQPDTDGDGIRDDLEDLNRNGIVDEGETSPVAADTDGDGIADGADTSPVPVVGALYLAGIELDSGSGRVEGPAEGGGRVMLSGRNLGPGTRIFFGDVPSPRVRYVDAARLTATVPPHPGTGGETVDIRALAPSGESGELPRAYRYQPRTGASLAMTGLQSTLAANRVYRGSLSIGLNVDTEVDIGPISFTIAVEPENEIASLRLESESQLLRQGRTVSQRRLRPGLWAFDISPPSRPAAVSTLGTLLWQSPRALRAPDFRCVTRDLSVLSSTGVLLNTQDTPPLRINLRRAITRPPQRR